MAIGRLVCVWVLLVFVGWGFGVGVSVSERDSFSSCRSLPLSRSALFLSLSNFLEIPAQIILLKHQPLQCDPHQPPPHTPPVVTRGPRSWRGWPSAAKLCARSSPHPMTLSRCVCVCPSMFVCLSVSASPSLSACVLTITSNDLKQAGEKALEDAIYENDNLVDYLPAEVMCRF
jgi:hypothetical protein